MRIENLVSSQEGGRARVAATVTYEDCDRPAQELYFETDEAFADGLTCNPNAFLVASIMPALRHGEERVFVDGEVCPELRDGLMTAMTWVRHWYYDAERKNVRIEARTQSRVPTSYRPERAGQFFSGGIDSLATLRANRLNYPLEHPGSIKDGLLVYGWEVGKDYDEFEVFENVFSSISEVAQQGGMTLIPVYTNLYRIQRDVDQDWHFWTYEFQGTAMAAVAHAFTKRLSIASIASTFDIANLEPWGSHPLLDPNYSSRDMQIRHDSSALSRLDKTKLVADWDVSLHHMRVCNRTINYHPDTFNCGNCEKCLRTMLGLIALGKMDQTTVFPISDVSPKLVLAKANVHNAYTESCYRELIAPLEEQGRPDLARAIEKRIRIFHDRTGRRAQFRQLDRKYLNGNLTRFKRMVIRQ